MQSKNRNIVTYIINNFFCLNTITKNIFLKMHIVDYHIFINLFIHHTKIILSNKDNLFQFLM